MSTVSTAARPRRSATAQAPRTPPAGPESTVSTGRAHAAEAESRPPADPMMASRVPPSASASRAM
jgi:hypothetical protein